jgi:hypothetical protein
MSWKVAVWYLPGGTVGNNELSRLRTEIWTPDLRSTKQVCQPLRHDVCRCEEHALVGLWCAHFLERGRKWGTFLATWHRDRGAARISEYKRLHCAWYVSYCSFTNCCLSALSTCRMDVTVISKRPSNKLVLSCRGWHWCHSDLIPRVSTHPSVPHTTGEARDKWLNFM